MAAAPTFPNIGGSQAAYPYAGLPGYTNFNSPTTPVNTTLHPYGGSTPTYPRTTSYAGTPGGGGTVGYTGSGWQYPQGNTSPGLANYQQTIPPNAGPNTLASPRPKAIPYTDQQIQAMFQQQVLGDPTLVGELGVSKTGAPLGTLPAQLAAQYQGSVLTPAQQAIAQFGGFSSDPGVQSVLNQLKGIAGPTFTTPYGTANLGQGLGAAITDPALLASAANNPYSTLAQNAYTYNRSLGQNLQGVYGGGGAHSSGLQNAINQSHYEQGGANYAAANALLSQITGNVTGFEGQLNQAAQTQAQYLQNAQNNIIALMQQGLLTIPTSYTPNVNPVTGRGVGMGTPQYIGSGPTSRFVQSNYGTYGRKPLY